MTIYTHCPYIFVIFVPIPHSYCHSLKSEISIIALTETRISQDDSDIVALFHNVGDTLLLSSRLSAVVKPVGFLPLSCISISYYFSYSDYLYIYRLPKNTHLYTLLSCIDRLNNNSLTF